MEEKSVAHSDHIVQMIIHSGHTTQAWLKFLITVEGALAVGFGFLVTASNRSSLHQWLAILVCFFGAGLCFALVRVLLRQHQWHAWFVKRYVAIPGNLNKVYPGDADDAPNKIENIERGHTARVIQKVMWLIVLGWVIAAIITVANPPVSH